MTRKKNYFKVVGSKDFVRTALKVIEQKFQVVFQTGLKESDTEDDVFFIFVNISDDFLESSA